MDVEPVNAMQLPGRQRCELYQNCFVLMSSVYIQLPAATQGPWEILIRKKIRFINSTRGYEFHFSVWS